MRTTGDDSVVRVALKYKGCTYSEQWYYNLGVREAVRRTKRVYGLTGKRGVITIIK